jgi:hypothetical protein
VIGLAMGSGLYEAAFSALVWLDGRDAHNVITGITLIAGFASTVGWPLSRPRPRGDERSTPLQRGVILRRYHS